MSPTHLKFCLYYLQTNDPGVAYKMAYPRAGIKSLYAAASRLMARDDVSAWIRETQDRVHERALRQVEDELGDRLKCDLMSINEKRDVLTKIIKGEKKRRRNVKTKYGYQVVEEDQPVYALLRAIDMDTRLENFYNYLTNPDTWLKARNLYVNTPTLQQQVNILIAQTTAPQNEVQPVVAAPPSDVSPVPLQQEGDAVPLTPAAERGNSRDTAKLRHKPGKRKKKTPHYLTKLNNLPPDAPQTGHRPAAHGSYNSS